MNKLIPLVIAAVLIFSCTSEKPTAPSAAKGDSGTGAAASALSQKPAGSPPDLEITPADATRRSTLFLTFKGGDLSGARIEWFVNNRPFTTEEPMKFKGSDAVKGDTIQAKAVVQDREVLSNIVQIKNSPPEITNAKILPEIFKPGGTLNVEVESADLDGDGVTFLYAWTRNGEPAGKGKSIEAPVKRGDKVAITITPFDGESYGKPVVFEREVKNLPPVIMEHNKFSFDGTLYTYQVKATDPDGDVLTYSLSSSPNGMKIDSSTGLLTWNVPPDFKGVQPVSVVVQDGHGGTASYDLKITITSP